MAATLNHPTLAICLTLLASTLILTAVGNRDYVIVQACLLLLVGVFIVVNLIADLSYGFLDPRIRLAANSRQT